MNPGQKVDLIKKLAGKLGQYDWNDLDLVLRQFGLPWSDFWEGGDRYKYALQQLEEGADSKLTALDEYLFGAQSSGLLVTPPKPESWLPNHFGLFLSHVSTHKQFVYDLKQELSKLSIDGFVAHSDIEPIKEWLHDIEQRLESCDALAAILTPDFHNSNWTDQEIGYCVKRRILIIPVKMGLDPYGFIARYQALPGSGRTAQAIAEGMFKVLLKHDLTKQTISRSLAARFEASDSFAGAKRNMDLIEQIETWTPEGLARLEAAVERNRQVKDSWGVPERVRTLVEKFGK